VTSRIQYPFFASFLVCSAALAGCSSSDSNPVAGGDTGVDSGGGDVASDAPTDAALGPCGVPAKRVVTLEATATESDVGKAFASAATGDSIVFGKGTFKFTNTLTVGVSGVAICGQGMEETTLDFGGQLAGSEGIYGDKSNDFLITKLNIKNTKGNGVKIIGATRVTFRAVKVQWTGADATAHGAYGLYPVQCKEVLIEDSVSIGASDAGLYIGQSDQVVVRRNRAEQNVAGIEIENTFNADVYDNTTTDNTAGILVFDLPDLPQLGGHNIRIFKNTMKANNRKNFAPAGNIVGKVPAGTGFFVMANRDVEVFQNTFDGNDTVNSAVVSFLVVQIPIKDTKYYPYPARVSIHDNTYIGGGTKPDPDNELGVLMTVNLKLFSDGAVSDILIDGILDEKKPAGANPMELCFKANKDATFANGHLDKLPSGSLDLTGILTTDATPHDCTLPALPKVTFPGVE
jgi:parallel beta-helix repeat protein